MLLKNADSKERDIEELERLSKIAPADRKTKIEQELRALRAGIKGEKESAYLIDFDFKEAERTVVIHDLRLEINGRVAQIDHLLIHRTLNCFVLETKHFHAGIQITEDGEFKQWNDFKKTYVGMASPLAQNERHIAVLKDAFERIELPTRAGIKLTPTFHSYVLVSPKARIDRPKKFDTSHIIKSDVLLKTIVNQFEKHGVLDVFTNIARIVSLDTIIEIGKRLVKLHKPATFDYASKFGLQNTEVKQVTPLVSIVATPEAPLYTHVVQQNPPQPAVAPCCPKCGADMQKRVARQGSNAGKEFWGCSHYPKCKGIMPIDPISETQSIPNSPAACASTPKPEVKCCPHCGSELVLRQFLSGPKSGQQFYGCVPCKKGWPVEQFC